MQSNYIIGVDIGTGSTKAVAVDQSGVILCSAQHHYSSINDGEKSEQDVDEVYDAFLKCIGEVVAKLQSHPAAISLSSAMHSILAVNEKGQPLIPAMLWSDTRSSDVAEALRAAPEGEEIYNATGTPLHSMSPLCKIRWLKDNNPEVFTQAHAFVSIKEAIWHRLFGEWVIDYSLASATGLFNIRELQWDETALAFAGITKERLSQPVPTTYKKSGVNEAAAGAMQLPSGTTFMIGASDGTLANLGSLCLSPTEAAITIGTSAAVRITSAKPVQNFGHMIFNYLLDEKTFVCGGAINNGGNVFQWLLKNLFAQHKEVTTYEQLFNLLATVPAGSEGLLFLPYLHGERAPIWDEKSSGTFVGLNGSHGLAHLARAVSEGVCFALHQILSSVEEICGSIEKISVSGGLVQSGEMMQLLADATGKKVVVQQTEDASALGAVFLAQKALGFITDYSELKRTEALSFHPDPKAAETYTRLFAIYKTLYPSLKKQMHLLHQLSN